VNRSATDIRRARAAAEAAEWAVRLDAGDSSTSERVEFVDWLRESPLHVSEMLRIGRLTSALSGFDDWDRIAPAVDVPFEDTPTVINHPRFLTAKPPRRDYRLRWFAGIAASVLVVVGSLVAFRQQLSSTHIRTQIGERREITLTDGSVVRLSPNTDLRIWLQPRLRSVMIVQGEALFHVAKDASRPFVVDAASAKVQAVGTMFSVVRNDESVIVTVAEGIVRVTPTMTSADASQPGAIAASLSLGANERVSVSGHGVTGAVRRVESVPMIDWADPGGAGGGKGRGGSVLDKLILSFGWSGPVGGGVSGLALASPSSGRPTGGVSIPKAGHSG